MDCFLEYYLSILLGQYADFEGKTSRKEFWMFVLLNAIVVILLALIDVFLLEKMILTWIYSIVSYIPNLAIGVRRLRDAGEGWYNLFWSIVPFGGLYLIYLYCKPSIEPQQSTLIPTPSKLDEPIHPPLRKPSGSNQKDIVKGIMDKW